MWRLLRAELSYNTQVVLFILLTSLLGFMGIHFWPAAFLAIQIAFILDLSISHFRLVMASNRDWVSRDSCIANESQIIREVRTLCGRY